MVKYRYDAWGKPIGKTNVSQTSIGQVLIGINPFIYKGYIYDDETGFYYLKSRYYSPVIRRFINVDVLFGDIGNITSLNLFVYCNNNPINGYDSNGNFSWGNFLKVLGGIALIGALVVGSVVTAGTLSVVLAGAAVGATMSAVGATVSTSITGDWDNFGNNFLVGTISGAISGGIGATGAGLLVQVAANATINTISYAFLSTINNDEITFGGLAVSFAVGVLGGLIGGPGLLKNGGGVVSKSFVSSGQKNFIGKMLTDFSKEVFENLGKEAINSIVISGVIDGLYSRFIADGLNPNGNFWGW